MELCVIGTGYVGLVVGTCMADLGFSVRCTDRDQAKIDALRAGEVPIYEPGLESILRRNQREGRLVFDTDTAAGVRGADVIYIAVGTPGLPDGSADLSGVLSVARIIGENLRQPSVIIIKSTVPVGTADRVRAVVAQSARFEFDVVSNPEFLKEGAAIDDFTHPDRIVVGCETERARSVMSHLYGGLVRSGKPILFMDNRSAELTKYASNALLATKISFMNELARLCEQVGADIEAVRRGAGSDSRIGPRFLFAGAGYGGSCFPKDVRALVDTARQHGVDLQIAAAVESVNRGQKLVLAQRLKLLLGEDLSGRRVAVWGLAFKPQTDDVREAPALTLCEELLAAGASVLAYDPEAMGTTRELLGDRIGYADSALDATEDADALVLVTEWNEFRNPDFAALRDRMRRPLILDGRNIYDPVELRREGFEYYGIGRR